VLLDIQQGADYLQTCSFVRPGGCGILGFCFGGRMALRFAARSRQVDAVVAFHPGAVAATEVEGIGAPVQIHCGTADPHNSVDMIESLRKMLVAQSTPVEVHFYDGADHGFLAYTRPTYKPDAAQLAWTRVTDFLRRHLE
jgi:carboxymethylenebutenolidase